MNVSKKRSYKPKHRILAGLMSLVFLFTMLYGYAPKSYAASEAPKNSVSLKFADSNGAELSDDGTSARYEISGNTQIVEMKLEVAINYALEDGKLTIKIPFSAFVDRDGNASYTMSRDAQNNLVGQLANTSWTVINGGTYYNDGYLLITNKDTQALQSTFTLQFEVRAFTVEDEAEQTFNIEVECDDEDIEISDEVTATFDTHVRNVGLTKEINEYFASGGCYYAWDDSLENMFKLLENNTFESINDFNTQCEDYYFVCYILRTNDNDVNQKSTIYIDENPENGEVLVVSSVNSTDKGPGTVLEKIPAPNISDPNINFKGDEVWVYDDYKGTLSPRFFVLVRYPKEKTDENGNVTQDNKLYDRDQESGEPIFSNEASVAFVGVDHPEDPEISGDDAKRKSIWQDAAAGDPGEIWGVEKAGHKDPVGALNMLRNGKDVTFSYDVTGVGLTYKYVAQTGGDLENANENGYANHGGPYKLVVVDDALYVNGLGTDGTSIQRLLPEDFHFNTFTLRVKHDVVEETNLKLDVTKSHVMPFENREQVEVWVMTEENEGEWVLDQTIENIPFANTSGTKSDSQYADKNNNTTFKFTKADEGIYRVKFVYNGANGNVSLSSTLTGVLKADGSTVKSVLENIEKNEISNFQLFNWDAEMGYGGKNNWEDPTGSDSIKSPTPDDMKNDLLNLEAELYGDEGHTTDRIAHRQVAQNNLTEATFYSGAAKQLNSDKWNDGTLHLEYYIAAITGGGAATEENLRELVEIGVIEPPTEIVFHELLPVGASIDNVEAITLRGHSNPNIVDFRSGRYSWNAFSNYAGMIESEVAEENGPKITWETEDIYIDDGSIRQMVTITVKYDEGVLPVVQLGFGAIGGYNYALGTVLRVNAVASQYDVTSTQVNNFAAHFVDKDGNTLEIDGVAVRPDDGSVFDDIIDKDGNVVFEDVDEDGDTGSNSVVGAEAESATTITYTGTELIKWIKEDQLDTYFKKYTQTYAGHDYTYKIQFFTNNGTVKNVIIYDSIEQAYNYKENDEIHHYEDSRHWKGTLRGIDLSMAEHAGFTDIKVYVNKERFYTDAELATVFNDPEHPGLLPSDLIAEKGWELVDSDAYDSFDWENVKTIAFSFGEDTYFGLDHTDENGILHSDLPWSVSVELKMTAPDDIHEQQTSTEQVLAYNNPAYYSEKLSSKENHSWSKATTVANTVTIGLKSAIDDIPVITKTYTGIELPENFEETCEFDIKPLNGAPEPKTYKDGVWGDVIESVSLTLNAEQSTAIASENGTLFFTEPGVYEYEISEKASNKPGVTYSGAKYKVAFEVTDEREVDGEVPQYAENTELDVEIKIYQILDDGGKKLDEAIEVTNIEFENKYTPKPVDLTFAVNKTLNTTYGAPPADYDYTPFAFVLTPEGNAPMPTGTGYDTDKNIYTATLAKGTTEVSFPRIEYTQAGVYTYTVTETNHGDAGFTYDETEYTIIVTVKDNNSQLEATYTVNGVESGNITFTNEYKPSETSISLPVRKTLNGEPPADYDYKPFAFVLTPEGNVPMPAGTGYDADKNTYTATLAKGTTEVSFPAIEYTKEGVYTYTVTETNHGDTGFTYDEKEYTVVVTVKDNNSQLEATYTVNGVEGDDISFTNEYKPMSTSVTLPVRKTLNGEPPANYAYTPFTFVLSTEGSAPMPTGTGYNRDENIYTVTLARKKTEVSFPKIEFTEVGEYTYTVTETNHGNTGFTYDPTVYTVDVSVLDKDGSLKATYTVNGVKNGVLSFTNDYQSVSTSVVPTVTKTLVGRKLNDEEFSFEMKLTGADPEDGVTMPDDLTATNVGGIVTFGEITFAKEGTYTVSISETAGEDYHISYDQNIIEITYTVTDVNGTLQVASNQDGKEIGFKNEHTPDVLHVYPEVTKTISGSVAEIKDYEFEFILALDAKSDTEGIELPEETTVQNDAEGLVQFGEITFTKPGTFIVNINEVNDGRSYITYDERVYTIIYDVTLNDEGVLELDVTTLVDGEEADVLPAFENKYTTRPDNLMFTVNKTLNTLYGEPMEDYKYTPFEFVLTSQTEGAPMPEGVGYNEETNSYTVTLGKGEVEVSFPAIQYSEVGEYTYSVTETNHGDTGFTYDSTVYTVKVTVVDNKKGELQATYTVNGVADGDITFINEYKPISISVSPEVSKTLVGRTLIDGEFTFEMNLADADPVDGVTMPDDLTATNIEGIATFGEIEFTKAGTYTVEISEVTGEDYHISYDQSVITITYTVTDENGTLVVVSDRDEEVLGFENEHTPDAIHVYPEVSKIISGGNAEIKDYEFEFMLELDADSDVEGIELPETTIVKNDEEGHVQFGEIILTKPGTFIMNISEIQGDIPYITYDERVYTIIYDVTLSEDGLLLLEITYLVDGEEIAYALPEFINTHAVGSLEVSKVVEGDADAKAQSFTFTVVLSDKTINGIYGDMEFENGVAVFKLKHGESKVATDLRAGITYTVTESDNDGYTVTSTDAEGMIEPDATAAALFVNTKSETSKTGDPINLKLWFSMLGISLLGILLLSYMRKRREW